MINETDTGFNNSDRLSNKASPEIQFTSESGLRIEIQGVELTTTKLEKDNFSINDDNGTYTIALSNGVELSDGTYNIVAKDDSGNESLIKEDLSFTIDRTDPVFSSVIDLGNSDVGHSTGDRVTNIDRPVVKFTAGEPALYIDIEYDSGDNSVSPVRIDNSKFSLDPLISYTSTYLHRKCRCR